MKRLLPLFTFLLISLLASAQSAWQPFINHYGREDYGDGTSTWRILPIDRWTFFANEKGLLVYNGVSWSRYQLNNRSEARGVAVFPDSRRVYVGGENEYGYFEITDGGTMQYHCLSDQADPKYRQIGNVWDIYQLGGSIYLRGDHHILVITGQHYNLIDTDFKIFASVLAGGVIYVATDHGLWMIAGERLLPVANTDILNNKRINAMLPYGQGILVTTATDGVFYYAPPQAPERFATAADRLLREGVICCAAARGDLLALGTIHNGLIVVNVKTGEVRQIDERRGLQNNTVLSVAFDSDGYLWAGMDYGIDQVLLGDPFSYLYRSPASYGIGYCAEVIDGRLYLGTDRGLYVASFPVRFSDGLPQISRVDCPSGPAWALFKHGNELFCMHDKGLFTIQGNRATRITGILGVWACQAVADRPDLLLIGGYQGIYVIRKVQGQWTLLGEIEGIREPCRYFRVDKHQVTVYNRNLGKATVYRLSPSLMRVVSQSKTEEVDPSYNGRELGSLFGNWDVTGQILLLDSSRQIIPYNRGFVLLDQRKTKAVRSVFISSLSTTYPADSLVYSANFRNVKTNVRIAYAHNSVRIDYQVPALHSVLAARYQYRLNGGPWSALSDTKSKEYSNLHEGEYTFEVRAVLKNGSVSTDAITFRIQPPWYRTPYAYLAYLVVAIVLAIGLYRVENRRIRRHSREAVAEKSREVDQMKVEIDKLEKDKLDLQLMHKSQEIANLVVSVGRKNETLAELKVQIKQVAARLDRSTTTDCRRQLLSIIGSIDSNMEGDEILRKFEEQFDQANNHFMQKLRSRHRDLNQNEIMMCAYLKMNLSTKEIAPLLNISVRGVETVRYRLRKKFGLGREDNLVVYLNNIQ